MFLFKADQDDVDVEKQRKRIENMLKDATNWNFHKFLKKLKEAMTPSVFENIKCTLLGNIYLQYIQGFDVEYLFFFHQWVDRV